MDATTLCRLTIGQLEELMRRRDISPVKQELSQALGRADVLVTPTSPIVSPRLGDDTIDIGDKTLPMRPLLRRLTLPFNLSGLPSCTIPCGISPEGLPIGLQIIGKPFDEATVLRVAHAYECVTTWHQQRPALA